MSKIKRILIGGVLVIIILILSAVLGFNYLLSPVSNESNLVSFTIESGTSKFDISKNLKEAGIIKNEYAFDLYIALSMENNLIAGTYLFDTSNSAVVIYNQITSGDFSSDDQTILVTFVEGKRITDYADIISENFNYTYDEVMEVMVDEEFINFLISEYDALTDEILDEKIYYPLEGYLYPDTYEFYEDATIEEIIEKLVSNTDNKISELDLSTYDYEYTIHEIITMASIVEIEANNEDDRYSVAQVIYTRLSINMTLGMDVTTYYGVQKQMGEELTVSDLADENGYNTRASNFFGLPVGAICNPSLESINAVINPAEGNYVYFYADLETGDVSFFEEYSDFVIFKNES